jgi:transposase
MTSLVGKLVPDDLWALVEPLLPSSPRPPYGGRHRTIPDRNCLAAIVFMARTSTPSRRLGPARAGRPAGLVAGQRGFGQRARQAWGDQVGANPVDRGKPGSKLHLVSERHGLPLTAAVTAANTGDTSVFAALLDDVPAVLTPARRRRRRPGKVDADKAYDSAANRAYLRRRGITPRIARRRIDSSSRLGRHRWVVERTLSWLSCYRRLGCGGIGTPGGGSRSCSWPVRLSATSDSNPSTEAKRRLSRRSPCGEARSGVKIGLGRPPTSSLLGSCEAVS